MDLIRRLSRIAFFAGLAVVLYASLAPRGASPELAVWDKLQHFAAYAALAAAAGIGFPPRAAWWLAYLLIAMGGAIELVQWLVVPGREGDLVDTAANAVGVVSGYLLALLFNSATRASISSSVR